MKQTHIVAALALLAAGAASAQSSVTIYGRLNVSAEQQENITANGKLKVLQNSASRIGFKGTEDLGGGLKAGFVLESGFSPDIGQGSGAGGGLTFGRQSEVNLSGGFGTLRAGNFTSEAYYATADYISMHNHDTGTSEDKLYAYLGRNTNKIAYRTPEFVKGMTLEGAVTAGEGGGRKRTYDFAANYAIGALQLGAGYEKADSATPGGSAKQYAVRALYEAGPVVLGAYVQRDTNGYGANLGDRTTYRGSVAYNFGANELHFNYGKSGDYSKLTDTKASQLTVGYNYNLSKRTKLYSFYSTVDNNKLNYFGFGAREGNNPANDFKDTKVFALGVRHNF